jgi:hypothetical protein
MKAKKLYWEMSLVELREATREFDKPMPGIPGKPLSPAMRKRLAEAGRRAETQNGTCLEQIPIVLDHDLLKKVDAAARKLHITRSELIARGLRSVLKKAS